MHEVQAKGILSAENRMNIYRGCSHGCIYCDSRSKCYQMDHAFEDIEVKANAPALLEDALRRKRKNCMIGTGAMTDPYIPLEMERGLVRECLSIIDKYGFGVSLITKSDRVLRDLDILKSINEKTKCVVQMTLTTYDEALCRKLEPNVSTTRERFEVLKRFRDEGIPTVVWLCPVLPYINDSRENISGILDYCAEAGVYGIICFGMGMTLREGNREYFYSKLDEHFPGMKERYIRSFGNSYELASPRGRELMGLFNSRCRQNKIVYGNKKIFEYLNAFEEKGGGAQLSLFD